jgi:hypothetical protein
MLEVYRLAQLHDTEREASSQGTGYSFLRLIATLQYIYIMYVSV